MTRKQIELQRAPKKKNTVDNPDTFSRILPYSTVQSTQREKQLQKDDFCINGFFSSTLQGITVTNFFLSPESTGGLLINEYT